MNDRHPPSWKRHLKRKWQIWWPKLDRLGRDDIKRTNYSWLCFFLFCDVMRWCGFEWVGNNYFFHLQTLDADICWEWTYVRGHRMSRNYSQMPCTCIPIRLASGLVCLSSVLFICLQSVSQYMINIERHDRAFSNHNLHLGHFGFKTWP